MQMRLKKLGLAIAVVGALGAILASSALGKMKTEEVEWKTGNPLTTTVTGSPGVNLKAGTHEGSTNTTFIVEAGTSGTTKYHLTATGIKCVSCTITNGSTNAQKASANGKIEFTGVTVMEPEGCEVEGGKVLTTAITAHADWMEEGVANTAFVKFEPTAGENTAFATVKVINCPLETTLVVKGTVFGQAANNTKQAAKEQPITFSKSIHETTNSTINVNGKTAILAGRGIAELQSGLEFGVE